MGAAYAEVWKNGALVAPQYHHSLDQLGYVATPGDALANRLYDASLGLVVDRIFGLLGESGQAAQDASDLANAWEGPSVGRQTGDVTMVFNCPGLNPDEINQRMVGIRSSYRGGVSFDQQWLTWPQIGPYKPSGTWR